jgi:hypothetical protein
VTIGVRTHRVSLAAIAVAVLAAAPAGAWPSAAGRAHRPQRPAPIVVRPRWRVVARQGVENVLVSGHYVYLGGNAGSGALIDDQTGRRVAPAPPAGCYFDNANSSALGGSWIVATCNPPPPGPRYFYELYSIPAGTWSPFTPDVAQMFALNADCKTGDPQCSASYVAIGERWIEFQVTCGYHCGPTTIAVQGLQSGQVAAEPAGVGPGGNQILDLSSPTVTQTLCRPLKVSSAGTIVPAGGFALDEASSGSTYLERCGSHQRRPIGASWGSFGVSPHIVLWSPSGSIRELDGLFLPSLRRLVLRLPGPVASACRELGPIACIQRLALTTRTLYLLTQGRVWATGIPREPIRRTPPTG